MNKINIVNSTTDHLDSYSNLTIQEIEGVTNGTCDEILCAILDKLNFDIRNKLIHTLSKKLSNHGFVTLKFYNATKLCKDVFKGNINSGYLSKIISENQSICIESDMIDLLGQIPNLNIHKSYNDNQYIIMVLQKKI